MKLISSLPSLKIVALVFAGFFGSVFSTPVFAGDNPASQPAQTQGQTATTITSDMAKTDYKDAFLKFVLDKAEKYSGAAEQAVSKAVDVATEQAPVLAHEFLVWKAWEHGIKGVLPLIVLIVGTILFVKQVYKTSESDGDQGLPQCFIFGTTVFILACAIPAWGNNILSFIQVLVAPRIYIIEQVLHLIK